MPAEVVQNVRKVKLIGNERYQMFLDKRVHYQEEAFTAPIPQMKLKFKASLVHPHKKSELAIAKDQHARVTQLLFAVNSGRNINDNVFSHENSPFPPSLTRKGKMHHGTKNEILEYVVPRDVEYNRPVTTVQMLRPKNIVTIGQCFTDVFAPYVMSWLETNNRIDVVWDVYSKTSLKSGTREQRGTGTRRKVTLSTKVPGNWASFLRVDLNKQELFVELAKGLERMQLEQVFEEPY